MRELGCEAFLGEQDAEITGRWLRKVESVMTQMRVPDDWQVSCATQLLSDRAQTWWEVIQSRRTTGICTWGEFRKQFETQFFSPFQCRIKEQEFLALKQGNMTVLDYERRFHDLFLFAPQFVTTEQQIIDRLRDGLRQELRQGLVALRFESSRELIEAAHALEACMSEGQQGQVGFGKRKDTDLIQSKPLFPKKGKSQFSQFRRKEGTTSGMEQSSGIGPIGSQSRGRSGSFGWTSDQKSISYPQCVRCGQKHHGDYSTTPGRCYVCRGEHRWRECPHLGKGCYYCHGQGHIRKDYPRRSEFIQTQQQSQSQQQSVTVNRPVRQSQ